MRAQEMEASGDQMILDIIAWIVVAYVLFVMLFAVITMLDLILGLVFWLGGVFVIAWAFLRVTGK